MTYGSFLSWSPGWEGNTGRGNKPIKVDGAELHKMTADGAG